MPFAINVTPLHGPPIVRANPMPRLRCSYARRRSVTTDRKDRCPRAARVAFWMNGNGNTA
jgi:hypothetical protein